MKTPSLFFLTTLVSAAAAQDLQLALPLACKIGTDCWVQQYADHDATSAVQDYNCGHETYDGHDGTDFRVRNLSSQVNVVASAPGLVRAVRDNEVDHLVRTAADKMAVQNRECGNGVVLDHANGWQTQYCHMRKGTITVKVGDHVTSQAKLGEVGYSGLAAFPHVHLTLRHVGKTRDPFTGSPNDRRKCDGEQHNLWNSSAKEALAYRKGEIIEAGFQNAPVELSILETIGIDQRMPDSSWPAMVAYAWAIKLSAGDTVTVTLQGPQGIDASNSTILNHDKAQYMLFAGKKKPPTGWPAGTYRGIAKVLHDSELRVKQEWQYDIQ